MTTDRYDRAKKVTLLGAFINALLGIIKLIGGFLFHSHALVADGLHSFADLLTDTMVLFASKYGSRDADANHPYGHQRFETAATLLLALLLILTGCGIAFDAFYELYSKSWDNPGFLAMPIALFSIVANELLFHYTKHVGKAIRSELIVANAWHHRSDALASVVVAIGLAGSMAGLTYLDVVAAILVGFMIIKMGLTYGWNSVKELVDTAVEPEALANIVNTIETFEGVEKIHQLRTRSMGGDILVDVHILVAPYLSVSEGHFIAQHLHHALIKRCERVRDVTVHVDPEDDEDHCPALHLPSRNTLESQLLLPWKQAYPNISSWTLHYLDGKLHLDLFLKVPEGDMTPLIAEIQKTAPLLPRLVSVRLNTVQTIYSKEHQLSDL